MSLSWVVCPSGLWHHLACAGRPRGTRSGRQETGEIMAAEPGSVQFSIGRVIGDSFGVLARNIVSFGMLALLISLLQLLFEFFVVDVSQPETAVDPTAMEINWGPAILGVLIAVLVSALNENLDRMDAVAWLAVVARDPPAAKPAVGHVAEGR